MSLRDKYIFIQQLGNGFSEIGALLPTGSAAAKALCAELRRMRGTKRILEVGCGTGPVTEAIVSEMGPNDKLTVCDLNESFLNHVKKRFEEDPKLKPAAEQVDFYLGDIAEYGADHENEFDLIISSIPFTTLDAETLGMVLGHYKKMLKPSGTLTYIEYAYYRDVRTALQPIKKNAKFSEVSEVIRDMLETHEYRTEMIPTNFPPAFVRSLRFEAPHVEAAKTMKADPERRRVSVGPINFCSDGMPVVGAFVGAGLLWKASGRKGWQIPLALAGVAAWLHRDPKRLIVANDLLCLSAADGKVLGVSEVRHPRLGDENWVCIEIALSPTNVHINRAPIAGRVLDRWDEPGGYSPAQNDESDTSDSHYIVLEGKNGRCAVAQRSGQVARKIFTWPQRGEVLTQGERYGMVRLGSRTNVFLPRDQVEVLVQKGDIVLAGRTPVAKYVEG